MTVIRGAAAAVTGAASGIGRALALELASRGCDLALADRDEAGLQGVAAEIAKAAPRKVSVHRLDVGEPGQIAAFAEAAGAAHPALNIVINNAGIENNEPRILIGKDARLMDLLQRFLPATYWKVMQRQMEKTAARRMARDAAGK